MVLFTAGYNVAKKGKKFRLVADRLEVRLEHYTKNSHGTRGYPARLTSEKGKVVDSVMPIPHIKKS